MLKFNFRYPSSSPRVVAASSRRGRIRMAAAFSESSYCDMSRTATSCVDMPSPRDSTYATECIKGDIAPTEIA